MEGKHATMNVAEAQEVIFSRIGSLNPTGVNGFEGLLAHGLTEVSEVDFRVVKSGRQHGTDLHSAPHNSFRLGLEAKRYGETTSLPTDGLKAKVHEAGTGAFPIDLWILAVSKHMDATVLQELQAEGEQHGMDVMILDRPADMSLLCDLIVLCAGEACESILKPDEDVRRALEFVRQERGFKGRRKQLKQRLLDGRVGYESARRSSRRWLEDAQRSLAKAKQLLGNHHNLLEPRSTIIQRRSTDAELNEWWENGPEAAVLIGDEGTGKSWAILDWVRRLDTRRSPLTVFVQPRDIYVEDVRKTIARQLAEQTGALDERFWHRRLLLWERGERAELRILVVIDGLNENHLFKRWSEWLQPLFNGDMSGIYRVAMSCWPLWWRDTLYRLPDLLPTAREIEVVEFNDRELAELLSAMNVKHQEFADSVIRLMRVPRLAALVFKHKDELEDCGDVTAERVVYMDWRDRLERRGVHAGASDEEMREFLVHVGRDLKSALKTMTRHDVIEALSDRSGKTADDLVPAIEALSSGEWLQPGEERNTFKLDRERVPYVLGATLVKAVGGERSREAVDVETGKFLDELKSSPLGVAALRAAVTISLLDRSESYVVAGLLSAWLSQPNYSAEDYDSFWRIAGLRPGLFLDEAETRWLNRSNGSSLDEVLIKGLARASDFSDFRKRLEERLASWLGTAWPDPYVGAFLNTVDRTSSESLERVAATQRAFESWQGRPESRSFAALRLEDHDGWSWLGWRALAVLSYIDISTCPAVLEAWALSRGAMGFARHLDEVAWILRMQDGRGLPEAIKRMIERLERSDEETGVRATKYVKAARSHTKRSTSELAFKAEEEAVLPLQLVWADDHEQEQIDAASAYLEGPGWRRLDAKAGAKLVNGLLETRSDHRDSALALLVRHIRDIIGILAPASRRRLKEWISEASNDDDEGQDGRRMAGLRFADYLLSAYDASPEEQSNLLLEGDFDADMDVWLPVCKGVRADDVAGVDLGSVPPLRIARWLQYLDHCLDDDECAALDIVETLVLDDDEDVRYAALVLAVRGRHIAGLRNWNKRIPPFDGSERSDHGRESRVKEYWSNVARLVLCGYSPSAEMWAQLRPECRALIATEKPENAGARTAFGRYVQEEFQRLRGGGARWSNEYWLDHEDAVAALVEHDLEDVLAWLVPWLEQPGRVREYAWMSGFPVRAMLKALSARAPDVALALYRVMMDSPSHGIASRRQFELLALTMPPSSDSDKVCNHILATSWRDSALMEFVCAASNGRRSAWVLEKVYELEARENAWDVATAYTLLGCCDESEEVDAIWESFRRRSPSDQWLRGVLRKSMGDYIRNKDAREAFREFWFTGDPADARHYLKVVEAKCDARIQGWLDEIRPEWKAQPYDRQVMFGFAVRSLNQAVKRDTDRRKRQLFHTRIGFEEMAPWNVVPSQSLADLIAES